MGDRPGVEAALLADDGVDQRPVDGETAAWREFGNRMLGRADDAGGSGRLDPGEAQVPGAALVCGAGQGQAGAQFLTPERGSLWLTAAP
jgi:hypothetical protein